ncbi:MAG: HAD-IC family P-type ATPase [Deltaproteobacteria bacterium]|nr:HAD-IC family P-type ATPase [Deltaproteobacteria bacterium]
MTTALEAAAAPASCGHCGLPARSADRYCCYGCELAHEIAAEAEEDHARTRGTLTFSLLLSMTVMMFSLFLYAEDIYDVGEEAGLGWMRTFYRVLSVVLATPVMGLAGFPLLKHAWRRMVQGQLSMSALIALGSFTAYGLSIYSVLTGGSDVYLDSASTSLVLATLGRYLEATARAKASGVIGPSVDAGQKLVRRVGPGPISTVAPNLLSVGDHVELDPEQVVPADLLLLERASEVNLAVLTGEADPVTLQVGQVVPAGAVPVHGGLLGEVLRPPRESTTERLGQLAQSLRDRPSRLLAVADTFARWLTPLVWVLALGTFAYWAKTQGLERGVINALAVVLVACPCSYAIATPLVHWLAMRRALASGVLVRNAEVLEKVASAKTIAFDKTGTLTSAELEVVEHQLTPGADEAQVRGWIRALEAGSPHPAARALLVWAGPGEASAIEDRRFEAGRGVTALSAQSELLSLGPSGPVGAAGDVALTRGGVVLATFTLVEHLRPEAKAAIAALKSQGAQVLMLSGDSQARAARIAEALGIEFRGELSPEMKVLALESLGDGAVIVGDGINDAPAIAGTTSFAMMGATGLSRGLAQVNLQTEDLRLIPWTIELGRRSSKLILWLLYASTLYNGVFLVLAMIGTLRPVWAGLSMLLSSFLILATASSVSTWPGPDAKKVL